MRIDAHQFFWKYETGQFRDRPEGEFDVLKNDFLPHDLLVNLVNNEIEGCIAVQNENSDEESNFLLELAEAYEFVLGVIGWIDLEDPNIGQKINYYKNLKIGGFRDSFSEKEDPYFALKREVIRGIELIGEYKIPLDIQCRPDQFPAVIDLVSIQIDQTFILNDMGFLPYTSRSLKSWYTMLTAMEDQPHVFCKINGVYQMERFRDMSREDIAGCIRHVLEVFGPERMIFGSDWPYEKLSMDYEEEIDFIEQVLDSLTQTEINMIFGENAQKVYLSHMTV